jgi:(1->4)-alpha-D-glucan 1-alpha-D-glucosylmutase
MAETPLATYRLQLHAGFGFAACRRSCPTEGLGVSHLYLLARDHRPPGLDPRLRRLRPRHGSAELGGGRLRGLARAACELGLGIILDIVPNHMAVSGDNPMLVDLLENGPDSRYFATFDIDWEHPLDSLRGRLLAPFLGSFFGEALRRGEIAAGFDARGFHVAYFGLSLPLAIASYPLILGLGPKTTPALGAEHPDYDQAVGGGHLYSLKNLPGRDSLAAARPDFLIMRLLARSPTTARPVRRHTRRPRP